MCFKYYSVFSFQWQNWPLKLPVVLIIRLLKSRWSQERFCEMYFHCPVGPCWGLVWNVEPDMKKTPAACVLLGINGLDAFVTWRNCSSLAVLTKSSCKIDHPNKTTALKHSTLSTFDPLQEALVSHSACRQLIFINSHSLYDATNFLFSSLSVVLAEGSADTSIGSVMDCRTMRSLSPDGVSFLLLLKV